MTGTTWKENALFVCWPTRDNRGMPEIGQSSIELVGTPTSTADEQGLEKAVQKAAGGQCWTSLENFSDLPAKNIR